MSKSGYIDRDLWSEYFDFFLEHRKKPLPGKSTILFVDGHGSHVYNPEVLAKAIENNVVIICFPAHCTNKMQPCDVSFFSPLKKSFRSAVHRWMDNNRGKVLKDANLGSLISTAWHKSVKPETAIKSFRICGLYPFSRTAFSVSSFKLSELFYGPAKADMREIQSEVSENEEQEPYLQQQDSAAMQLDNSLVDADMWAGLMLCDPYLRPLSPVAASISLVDQSGTRPDQTTEAIMIDLDQSFPQIELGAARDEIQVKRRSVMSTGGILTETQHVAYTIELKEKRERREARAGKKQCGGSTDKHKTTSDGPSTSNHCRASATQPKLQKYICGECSVDFYNDKLGTVWLQCKTCEIWLHKFCGVVTDVYFYCQECSIGQADNEVDDEENEIEM